MIKVNNVEIENVVFNGVELDKVIYNGVVVFEKRTFDPEIDLIDFYYEKDNNANGYIILGWKGTYKGEPSTRCIIPDYPEIILGYEDDIYI